MAGDFSEQVLNEKSSCLDGKQALVTARYRQMRDACPELREIDIAIARAARTEKATIPNLNQQRESIIRNWLENQKLPQDWLIIQHDCILCQDSGYYEGQVCTCIRNEVARRLYNDAGLTKSSPSFDKFDLTLFSESIMTKTGKNLREYMEFLRSMGQTYTARFPNLQTPNLLFTGPTGCGKSYLLDCIAAALIERGFWVVRATAFGANEIMTKSIFDKANSDHLFECDLLALDDLGSEPLFSKSKTYLFNLLNERMATGKPYIISTNLSQNDILQRYEERIYSRITDQRITRIIEFEGGDLRQCR